MGTQLVDRRSKPYHCRNRQRTKVTLAKLDADMIRQEEAIIALQSDICVTPAYEAFEVMALESGTMNLYTWHKYRQEMMEYGWERPEIPTKDWHYHYEEKKWYYFIPRSDKEDGSALQPKTVYASAKEDYSNKYTKWGPLNPVNFRSHT